MLSPAVDGLITRMTRQKFLSQNQQYKFQKRKLAFNQALEQDFADERILDNYNKMHQNITFASKTNETY